MQSHVQQRLWVDPRQRRRRYVTNVVRARPARAHPQPRNLVQHRHQVAWLKLAKLHVRPRRQIAAPAAPVLRHLGQPTHLRGAKHRPRNAQPEHERVLRRSHVKESVTLKPVRVLRIRSLVLVRVRQQLIPRVERVALILPKLFAAQVINRRAMKQRCLILCPGVRIGRDLARRVCPANGMRCAAPAKNPSRYCFCTSEKGSPPAPSSQVGRVCGVRGFDMNESLANRS